MRDLIVKYSGDAHAVNNLIWRYSAFCRQLILKFSFSSRFTKINNINHTRVYSFRYFLLIFPSSRNRFMRNRV